MESIPSTIGSLYRAPTIKLPPPVNVNTATIFDLMTVNGINQALAAKIITYRERRGRFKTVNDLKNAGASQALLSSLRMYLTTEDDGPETKPCTPCPEKRTPNGKNTLQFAI